uniref:Uncharacterized protein n=1 Tax=Arundo donax TaxID=35708 RepID=A0A0A9G624_ARUDO
MFTNSCHTGTRPYTHLQHVVQLLLLLLTDFARLPTDNRAVASNHSATGPNQHSTFIGVYSSNPYILN